MTLLIFEVAGELCAIPADSVAEIVAMAALARSPGLPAVVEGILNLRGCAVPVIRLDRLFGLPPEEPGLYSHVLVLRNSATPAALLARRAVAIVTPAAEAFRPLAERSSFNDCALGEVDFHGRPAHVLSPQRLLLEEERRRAAEFQARAQAYIDALEAPAP